MKLHPIIEFVFFFNVIVVSDVMDLHPIDEFVVLIML